jgi:phosphatidylserine/phosphatidylglycerophosphate/cardiolipin synthase-like enzyme
MRFRSPSVGGFRIFAVAGINTVSFGITATTAAKKGLLGFSVERFDKKAGERYTMPGFKVFRSIIPNPTKDLVVSTHDHPVQSLSWDDFTAKPDRVYEYTFQPVRGKPKNLDRSGAAITIAIRTEPLYTTDDHDVFFNRGVASSQAYEERFHNLPPDKQPTAAKKVEALQWLTRDLDDAILKFIDHAGANDSLICAFYEFHYPPVVKALAEARKRVRRLQIIIDAKVNEFVDKAGKKHKSFPRTENLAAIQDAGIPDTCIIRRDANPNDIQHNKFMVLLKGAAEKPTEVWSGSTNISLGGFSGQTNVGHWVRDEGVAAQFAAYWNLLAQNPGSKKSDDKTQAAKKRKAYRDSVEALLAVPTTRAAIAAGTTAIFSPRSGDEVLNLYVDLVDNADAVSCITLAFGVNDTFKTQLKDNTPQSHITFLLLEKKDQKSKKSTKPFVAINASNNVYKAWGSFIRTAVYQWARETNARALQLNTHVSYIHSKFLLHDPLGDDPIVVTGSANFSDASTNSNDENMIVIRGNPRVADIYFTEFNRLFNHYYYRSVTEDREDHHHKPDDGSLFLAEKSTEWLAKYAPGRLKAKRVKVYAGMTGFTTI